MTVVTTAGDVPRRTRVIGRFKSLVCGIVQEIAVLGQERFTAEPIDHR